MAEGLEGSDWISGVGAVAFVTFAAFSMSTVLCTLLPCRVTFVRVVDPSLTPFSHSYKRRCFRMHQTPPRGRASFSDVGASALRLPPTHAHSQTSFRGDGIEATVNVEAKLERWIRQRLRRRT